MENVNELKRTYPDFKGVNINPNITLSIKESGKTVEAIKKAEKVGKIISTTLTYAFIVFLALGSQIAE